METLKGKRVAILVEDGFEQVELLKPREALEQAGALTQVVSPHQDQVKGWDKTNWGETVPVDVPLAEAQAADYDALLLPGGIMNPDHLRGNKQAVDFVGQFMAAGKPVAAICHGPWTLIETGTLQGRTLTSYPSIRTDLKNAGADWVDQQVVVDRGLITSRKPADIPAFNQKMIEEFGKGGRRQ
jgi:protease I